MPTYTWNNQRATINGVLGVQAEERTLWTEAEQEIVVEWLGTALESLGSRPSICSKHLCLDKQWGQGHHTHICWWLNTGIRLKTRTWLGEEWTDQNIQTEGSRWNNTTTRCGGGLWSLTKNTEAITEAIYWGNPQEGPYVRLLPSDYTDVPRFEPKRNHGAINTRSDRRDVKPTLPESGWSVELFGHWNPSRYHLCHWVPHTIQFEPRPNSLGSCEAPTMLSKRNHGFTVGNKAIQMFGSFGLCIEYIFWLNG